MNGKFRKQISTTNSLYPRLNKVALGISRCSIESAAYSACCLNKSMNINQYDCKKEYDKLITCLKKKAKTNK
jgi:hypothetical protein